MTHRNTLTAALVVAGIALLIVPALFPLQPMLYHDTSQGTLDDRTELEEQGYEVIAYENLSERGQALYVRTLKEGGRYGVSLEEGATDFAYPTPGELGDVENYRDRNALESIVIERPPEADLPAADEPLHAADHYRERQERRERTEGGETEDGPSEAERRQQIERYDLMTTRTDQPPLTAPPSILRLLSAVVGVLAIGTGGYLRSKP